MLKYLANIAALPMEINILLSEDIATQNACIVLLPEEISFLESEESWIKVNSSYVTLECLLKLKTEKVSN